MELSTLLTSLVAQPFIQYAVLVYTLFCLHVGEEQGWPGKFILWWNYIVCKSPRGDFPLTPEENRRQNIVGLLILGTVLVVLAILVSSAFLLVLISFVAADTAQHLIYTIVKFLQGFKKRAYSPGAITSLLFYLPILWVSAHRTDYSQYALWLKILCVLAGFAILGKAHWSRFKKKAKEAQ